MLRLRFKGAGVSMSAGPNEEFRVEQTKLLNPRGEVLARYDHGHWDVGTERCTRIDIREPFFVRFQGARGLVSTRGPFEFGAFDDGMLVEGADDRCVAKLALQQRMWHDNGDGRLWPLLVLQPPGAE
ncbi:MAG TPA: hypothetical protein VG713_08485 [Pirellulales bacterium]|nr:hypothetical protein [Pirellulales bacterium]